MNSNKRVFGFVLLAAVCLLFLGAENPKKKPASSLHKTALVQYKFLDGNKVNCTLSSEGPYCDYRRTNSSGCEWPKGSGKTPIYTAGIWLAGIHRPTHSIRVSDMDYTSEYQPGPILSTFNTTTNDIGDAETNAADPRYRLYKIAKRDTARDATGKFITTNADFLEWPGDLGAPYEDRNDNGVWDPGVDMPKFWGDFEVWCVINDLTDASHNNLSTSRPLGVEIQVLYFGFNQAGALGDMMFMRWKIINKSDAHYDSTFIGMWSDPDLGDGNDDLPGCDTTLSLGYLYNGDNNDTGTNGYGATPPAAGFDFFQGPRVPSPADSAIWDGVWHQGYRNLPASSYVVYTNNTFAQIVDPPDRNPDYPAQAYDYLNGKCGTIHQPLMSGGHEVKFWFSGDPVAGTGDLPSNFPLGTFAPQDIRMMISTGPFSLAPGDTQEIVGSLICAQGADRLSSISKLKQVDAIAQQAFNDNFNVPAAPPMPPITVTEAPTSILLDWSANTTATESYSYRGYVFEGYKLYQTLNPFGTKVEWQPVRTFDIKNGVGNIIDYVNNPDDGKAYLQPVILAPDTGLGYHFLIDQDYISGTPLTPGKKYYFALTTYARNNIPGALEIGLPLSLEAPKDVIETRPGRGYIMPIGDAIGTDVPIAFNSYVTHSRPGDDAVMIEAINPRVMLNMQYGVTFNGVDTNVTSWNLLRYTPVDTVPNPKVDTLLKNIADFSGSSQVKIADGILVRVHKPALGPRRDTDAPRGYQYTPSANFWFRSTTDIITDGTNLASDAMNSTLSYPRSVVLRGKGTKAKPDSLLKIEIRFDSSQTQRAFRFARLRKNSFGALPPPADSSFLPFMTRRTKVGVQYQDRVNVPFTVWDVDQSNGAKAARQLNVAFLETNDSLYTNDSLRTFIGRGKIDGKWEPTTGVTGGGEWLYIFASSYDTMKYVKSRKTPLTDSLDIDAEQDSLDIMYMIKTRALAASSDTTGKTPVLWKNGDVLTLTPYYTLDAGRKFYYQTTAPTFGSTDLAKNQLDMINVFPNPYFGHNKAEPNTLARYITFSHLPPTARIRIFTLNGELVRTLNHVDETGITARTYERWDLRNENGLPVASGMYIVHVEIEGVGNRILKVAIIQPEERATRL